MVATAIRLGSKKCDAKETGRFGVACRDDEEKHAFAAKVISVGLIQLLATCLIAALFASCASQIAYARQLLLVDMILPVVFLFVICWSETQTVALVGLVGFTVSTAFYVGVLHGLRDPTIVYKMAIASSIVCGLIFAFAWGYRIGLSMLGEQPYVFAIIYFLVTVFFIFYNAKDEMIQLLGVSLCPLSICSLMIFQLPEVFKSDLRELKDKGAILVASNLYWLAIVMIFADRHHIEYKPLRSRRLIDSRRRALRQARPQPNVPEP